jgi:hypothetical protein
MSEKYDHKSDEWLVYAVDWYEVIARFGGPDAERAAKAHAEILDGLALRAVARPAPHTRENFND